MIKFINFAGSPIYIAPESVIRLTRSPTVNGGNKPETAIHQIDGTSVAVVGDIDDIHHKLVVK